MKTQSVSNLEEKTLTPLEVIEEKIGTNKSHLENYIRIILEMKNYRERNPQIKRNYNENIFRAQELVKNLHLIHLTKPEHYNESILGLKPAKLINHQDINCMPIDRDLGLDNFVFASLYHEMPGYEGIPLYLNPELLNREGTIFSIEDIAITLRREVIQEDLNKEEWITHPTEGYMTTKKTLKDEEIAKQKYKKSLMPGNKFTEFMTEFIATYYSSPEMYQIGILGRPDIKHIMKADAAWKSPEIKIYGEIDAKDIGQNYYALSLREKISHEREATLIKKIKDIWGILQLSFAMTTSSPQEEKIWKY